MGTEPTPPPAPDPLEAELRSLCAAGERGQAAQLAVRRYGPELLRFAHALLRSRDAAEEAFADACEKLWSGLPSFRFECSFRTWAFLVTRRVCFDRLRDPASLRHAPLSAAGPVSGIAQQVRTDTRPFLRTDVKDRFRALREALDPEEQALLTLRIDRELPWSEIAIVLHDLDGADPAERRRREAALRKRLERLKDRLREEAVAAGLLGDDPQ